MSVHRPEEWPSKRPRRTVDTWCDSGARAYVRSLARSIAGSDRHLADDLEQEVMLIALGNRPRDGSSWQAWLRAVTRNTFRYGRFREATRPSESNDLDATLEAAQGREIDPPQLLSQVEIKARLERLLAELPHDYRQVVYLRAIEEMPPRFVAEELGIPVETVRTRYRRAIAVLRDMAERELGEDSIREWRLSAWLTALWRRPRRRSAFIGTTTAAAGAGALYLASAGVFPSGAYAPVPQEIPAGIHSAPPAALPSALAGARAPAAPSPAPTESSTLLTVKDELGRAVPGLEVYLRAEDGTVVTGRTDQEGQAQVDPHPPGIWTAWMRGHEIATSNLPPGRGEWELTYPAQTSVHVTTIDEAGRPLPGIEVFRFNDTQSEVASLGRTDAAGHLSAKVQRDSTWIAGRGEPGQLSAALYVDQPTVAARDGSIELVIRHHDLKWRTFDFRESTPESERRLIARPATFINDTDVMIGTGVTRNASWLPLWEGPEGVAGNPSPGKLIMALDALGKPWWISDKDRRLRGLPLTLRPRAPFSVSGQLLDPDGAPLPNQVIHQGGLSAAGSLAIETRTDADGHFRLDGCVGDQARLTAGRGQRLTVSRSDGVDDGQGCLHVAYGPWQLRKRSITVERTAGNDTWRCTGIESRRQAIRPRVNPKNDEFQRGPAATATGLTCSLEAFNGIQMSTMLVESGIGEGARALLVRKPKGGWLKGPVRVDLSKASAIVLRAKIDPSRFPIRAVWREASSGLTSDAIPDPVTGEINSRALPAGQWSLDAIDRRSVSIRSDLRDVGPGEKVNFGLLHPNVGTLRVSLANLGAGYEGPRGALWVADEKSGMNSRTPVVPDPVTPFEILVECSTGTQRIHVALGDQHAVAKAVVARGLITDVVLTPGQFFLGLDFQGGPTHVAPYSLVLRSGDGVVHWRDDDVQPGEQTRSRYWAQVPIIEGARLSIEADGSPPRSLIEDVGSNKRQRFFSFAEWNPGPKRSRVATAPVQGTAQAQ